MLETHVRPRTAACRSQLEDLPLRSQYGRQSPDGKQTSSGWSFIREPNGIPLAEAGCFQEEMITAVLDLSRADRSYTLDSLRDPPFLRKYWEAMVQDVKCRADRKPE